MPGRIARDYATHATANADDGDGSTVRAQSQGDERLREAIHERSGVLEYVESERRLVWTDRTGPREYGASAIVAENVLPWFGRMLRAALDREAER